MPSLFTTMAARKTRQDYFQCPPGKASSMSLAASWITASKRPSWVLVVGKMYKWSMNDYSDPADPIPTMSVKHLVLLHEIAGADASSPAGSMHSKPDKFKAALLKVKRHEAAEKLDGLQRLHGIHHRCSPQQEVGVRCLGSHSDPCVAKPSVMAQGLCVSPVLLSEKTCAATASWK